MIGLQYAMKVKPLAGLHLFLLPEIKQCKAEALLFISEHLLYVNVVFGN